MNAFWQRRKWDVLGVILALTLAVGLIAWSNMVLRPRARAGTCQTNLKQIGMAMSQYIRNYDEKFSPAENWSDVLLPYLRGWGQVARPVDYSCPARSDLIYGYAMNRGLAQLSLSQLADPVSGAGTVLSFDSDTGRANASDAGTSLPSVPRHPNGHAILFVDWHVEFLTSVDFARGLPVSSIGSGGTSPKPSTR